MSDLNNREKMARFAVDWGVGDIKDDVKFFRLMHNFKSYKILTGIYFGLAVFMWLLLFIVR